MKKKTIEIAFQMFQFVYLVNDAEQLKRQVIQINILPGGLLTYTLSCCGAISDHYEEEISTSKDYTAN